MKCRKVKGIQRLMRKIKEIFLSVQGEGCHTGVPSIFIRFSGCNLRCNFCDTEHDDGSLMSDDHIIQEVKKHRAQQIVLTGGEPSIQIDNEFIALLKQSTGLPVAIETNGTRKLPDGIDWVTVSPKADWHFNGEGDIKVTHADELKVVDMGQDLVQYFKLECVDESTVMLLQPCHVSSQIQWEKNVASTVKRVLMNPEWRLSLQTHKYIGIP